MLKRSGALFILVVFVMVLLAGCKTLNNFGGDLLKDKAAMKNLVKEMKKQGGTPLMLFRDVSIANNFVSFSRQDPRNMEKVDQFMWSTEAGWQPAKKVVLLDEEKEYINDSLYRVDDISWEAIVDFVENAEKKAKEEGIQGGKVSTVTVHLNIPTGKLSFKANVSGKTEQASVTGEVVSGWITKFEKNN